jgi:hypothetical protein
VTAGSKLGVTHVELIEKLVVANNAFRNDLDREELLDTIFLETFICRCEDFAESAMPDSIERAIATGDQTPVIFRPVRIVFEFCRCHFRMVAISVIEVR